ncbi:WxcM-like domain-containing protein [Rhodocytophaga rosea]|uniref:WxcM-like domain-containing protein n=1 Tax=Rhodocytophaga rosea TaxID=2704465 RepID=A0A6C0GDR2_9BACT|nr:FdtA/QdtA family cupin domain-containing protein [Rhodocytophaga rosea]QHT66078.1 WxcM-like domain-containing protein [Rhodocytophaga rosea]
MEKPYVITFPKLGDSNVGYISVAELEKSVPFEVKRIFWTYFTPENIIRGRHAHYHTQHVLIAVNGQITITAEMPGGDIHRFVLSTPEQGLYIPPCVWPTMQYSHHAVQLALASTEYTESDYIREYARFKEVWKK